ncbi:ATP-dependent DNA helicase RecG, partial [bacterium]|nr:ATP-dependent DNA helicase RecG [bacterium]
MAYLDIKTSIQYLKGVGPRRKDLLYKLGISTVEDLIYFFPRTHEDRSEFKSIRTLEFGKVQTVRVRVASVQKQKLRKNLSMLKITFTDNTGFLNVTYFNQSYLEKMFKEDSVCILSGVPEYKFGLQMINPSYEFLSGDADDLLHTGRIVPIYPLTQGMFDRQMRALVKGALDDYIDLVDENIPKYLRDKFKLIGRKEAVLNMHFPENAEMLHQARRRLVFEEFFVLQIGVAIKKQNSIVLKKDVNFNDKKYLTARFLENLPFDLTGAQKRVIEEISRDMNSSDVMHRLVQGDVGSGKTIVAVYALLHCVENGYQSVLMAPTEILAEQHYIVLKKMLEPLDVRVGLLVGGQSKKEKTAALESIKNNECHIVVGTHALIEDNVVFDKLGLVVIDEQHKFGVMQRAKLKAKGQNPDMLIMTATPIPRTLSMTLYGDLDVSIIDEMPKGRKPIKTYLVSEKKRDDLNGFVKKELNSGRQAYFVYPLVEESEKIDLKSAVKFEQHLAEIFSGYKVGLIHGRMKSDEKDEIMTDFKSKKIDILVSTTVIEVGIDVPNASVIVIEDANRFGLAQLHQLRGRVGRSEHQSYCFLIANA